MSISTNSFKKNLTIFSHRGFGEKAFLRYQKKQGLQSVENQLSGVEIGIEKGADTLELDLSKTKDGKIVTAHGIPFTKTLFYSQKEYLDKYPETFTLDELLDWTFHQDINITLYLELKSPISIKEIINAIQNAKINAKGKSWDKKLYKQIMLYSPGFKVVKNLLNEKRELGLKTNEIRIWWVSLDLITKNKIDQLNAIQYSESKLYGIELGTIPWGFKAFILLMESPFSFLPPIATAKKYFNNIESIVDYSHKNQLHFIVGGVNNARLTKSLIQKGVEGIVLNNPQLLLKENVIPYPKKYLLHSKNGKIYIPFSMEKRLTNNY